MWQHLISSVYVGHDQLVVAGVTSRPYWWLLQWAVPSQVSFTWYWLSTCTSGEEESSQRRMPRDELTRRNWKRGSMLPSTQMGNQTMFNSRTTRMHLDLTQCLPMFQLLVGFRRVQNCDTEFISDFWLLIGCAKGVAVLLTHYSAGKTHEHAKNTTYQVACWFHF